MRVLLVTGSFPPMTCGVGDYTRSLAHELARSVDVAVLTSVEAGPAGARDRCEMFPCIRTWAGDELPAVRDVVRRWQPDVVHVQLPTQGYRGNLAPRLPVLLPLAGLPVVQTWHEYFPVVDGPFWRVLSLGLPPGDVIVVRPGYRHHMALWHQSLTAMKRIHLIPNASTIPRATLSDSDRAAWRRRYAQGASVLLAFFGFLLEHKGIDDALQIMDVHRHHLILIGEPNDSDPYQRALLRRIAEPPFAGRVTVTGFLSPADVACTLAAADAVVLPFRNGGGSWNTSLHAAILQGTFVLTTSTERHGFDADANTYYARPGDRGDLKQALERYAGHRGPADPPALVAPAWPDIAARHLAIYERNIRSRWRVFKRLREP